MRRYQYHIGLMVDWHKQDRSKPLGGRLTIEARRNVDYLSCELWRYEGVRETTKRQLRQNAQGIMTWVNGRFGTEFTSVVVD